MSPTRIILYLYWLFFSMPLFLTVNVLTRTYFHATVSYCLCTNTVLFSCYTIIAQSNTRLKNGEVQDGMWEENKFKVDIFIPYHSILYHTTPYYTIPLHTIPYHSILYHTTPYYTIPLHTIPYHSILYRTFSVLVTYLHIQQFQTYIIVIAYIHHSHCILTS